MVGIPKLELQKVVKKCDELNITYVHHGRKEFNGKVKWVIRYRCEIHGETETSWDSMRNSKGCKYCSYKHTGERNKLNIEQAREEFSKRGYELLETEYRSAKTKMKYKCPHHPDKDLSIHLNNLKSGYGCPYCAGVVKYTYEEVREEFEKRGFILNDDKYVNNITPLRYVCHIHPDKEQKMYLTNLLRGQGCYYCGRESSAEKNRTDFEEIKRAFEEKDYILLEKEFINSLTPMRYICPHHSDRENYITYAKIKSGQGCNDCGNEKIGNIFRKTQEQFEESIDNLVGDEYKVISKYINNNTHIKIIHNVCGYEYAVLPNNFLGGRRCPKCRESKGEKRISTFLDGNHHITYERQFRFPDCKNQAQLPFDFAVFKNKKLSFLIEYQGIQHFKPIAYFGGEEGYKYIKRNDEIKRNYCIDNKLKLLEIHYLNFNSIEDILKKELLE
ncbi:DUF723 domain-containing protein [Sporosarcina sp. SG10008]|uniref:DUF723 domain-containing protein n=1 Tax=Sporosarcina sp. SG10008 TaxID=3373103 RepID=UPI0037DC692E